MFIPNNTCTLYRALSGHTEFGEATGFDEGTIVKCGVVRISQVNKKTSVRADSSASRGAADEASGKSVILFPNDVTLEVDDAVVIAGFLLEITGIEPRYRISGALDHYEVDLERKEATDGITF